MLSTFFVGSEYLNNNLGKGRFKMRIKEINKVLSITGKESAIFMPNEIFSDLQGYITKSTEIAYAYSYTYLCHYLYRTCKYFNTEKLIDGDVIKEILGYSSSNRTMNKLTKKGGLLEEIGYLESTKDFPLGWEFKNPTKNGGGEGLTFDMSSTLDKDALPPMDKRFFLKRPIKGFERIILTQKEDGGFEEDERDGTFYDISNTHTVDFKVFVYCMANKDLGVVAFYLYSWLKYKNDMFPNGYDVPLDKLVAETGIARRTLIDCMDLLKGYRMITFQHNQEYFVVGMFTEDRRATTYRTEDYYDFVDKPLPFKKMEFMSRSKYLDKKKVERDETEGKKERIIIEESELPF